MTNRRVRRTIFLCCCFGIAITVALLWWRAPRTVPQVTLHTVSDTVLHTADWHGKIVIVNFWATWCAPCRKEIPDLLRVAAMYPDIVRVIGINSEHITPEKLQRFIDAFSIHYPVVPYTETNTQAIDAFGAVLGLPTTIVFDRNGTEVLRHAGIRSFADIKGWVDCLHAGLPVIC